MLREHDKKPPEKRKKKAIRTAGRIAKYVGSGILDVLPIPRIKTIKDTVQSIQRRPNTRSIYRYRFYLRLARLITSIVVIMLLFYAIRTDIISQEEARRFLIKVLDSYLTFMNPSMIFSFTSFYPSLAFT